MKEGDDGLPGGQQENFHNNKYVHFLGCADGFSIVHICQNSSNCIHFKYV